MAQKFPFKIEELSPEMNAQLSSDFSEFPERIRVGTSGMMLPPSYRKYATEFYNFKLYHGDIIIAGFPRSGTTLTQEIVWLISNDFDFDKAKQDYFEDRVKFLDRKFLVKDEGPENYEILKRPRIFKTHLHFDMLHPDLFKKCKIIYIARNPKDMIVSYYNFMSKNISRPYTNDFRTFFNYIINDLVNYTPYWAHIKQAWQKRNQPNFRFIFYEDWIHNLRNSLTQLATFLDKTMSDADLEKMEEYLKIDNFKIHINYMFETYRKNPQDSDNRGTFIRKGISGDWKNYFDEEMVQKARQWCLENASKLGGLDDYPYIKSD